MTINFFEPNAIPQPPENVKIEHLVGEPYDDGWRIRVEVHVTPFQQRPSMELYLLKKLGDNEGRMVSNLSIVETMHHKMEFHMHVRGVDVPQGDYKLRAVLFFREAPVEGETTVEKVEPSDIQEFLFTIEETHD